MVHGVYKIDNTTLTLKKVFVVQSEIHTTGILYFTAGTCHQVGSTQT